MHSVQFANGVPFILTLNHSAIHNFELSDLIIDILQRVGGGSYDFFDDITRFVIGTSLTVFLVLFAASRKSSDYYEQTRERYLFQGFAFACARNIFMLSIMLIVYATSVKGYNTVYGSIHIVNNTNTVFFLESIFPPIEQLLHFLQTSYIAMAFVYYLTKETFIHKHYIKAIYIAAGSIYLFTAYERYMQVNPFSAHPMLDSLCVACSGDIIWNTASIISLMWPAVVIYKEKQTWLTKTVLLILTSYFLYNFGEMTNIWSNGVYAKSLILPIINVIDLSMYPLFLYIYVRENQLRLEEKTNSVRVLADQLETFVRGTVHELRSPVAGIEGTLDILSMQYAQYEITPEEDRELDKFCKAGRFCKKIVKATERMTSSISHISDVLETMSDFGHTSDQSKMEYYNLEDLLHKSIKAIEFQDALKKLPHDTITINEIEGNYRVLISPVKFRQIIDNLIRNSVYAILKQKPTHPEIGITLKGDDYHCYLEVWDNGIGMTEDEMKNCFVKAYTSKGIDGSGLGLYFTAMFMDEFHGDIKVQSMPTKGTLFTLTFPISQNSIMGKECRTEFREDWDENCEVERIRFLNIIGTKDREVIEGRIINISPNGAGLKLNRPIKKKQRIRISYGKNPSSGEIRWVEKEGDHWLVGVKFDNG